MKERSEIEINCLSFLLFFRSGQALPKHRFYYFQALKNIFIFPGTIFELWCLSKQPAEKAGAQVEISTVGEGKRSGDVLQ